MTWLRDHLVPLLIVASVLMAVGAVSGWVRAAHHKGIAEANAAEVRRLEPAVQDAERRAEAHRVRAEAAEERADSAGEVAEEAEAETQRVREESAATIAELDARIRALDAGSAERAAEAEAEAAENDGWVRIERYRADTDSLNRRVEMSDSVASEERRAKVQERVRGDAQAARADALEVFVGELRGQVGGLTDQVSALRAQSAAKDRQIQALERANRSGGIFPDFGVITKPLYFAIGAGVGFLGGKVR